MRFCKRTVWITYVQSGVDFTHSLQKNHSFPHAVRILSCNLLRVVTSPHSLNLPSSGFCHFWALVFVGLGLSSTYPLARLLLRFRFWFAVRGTPSICTSCIGEVRDNYKCLITQIPGWSWSRAGGVETHRWAQ